MTTLALIPARGNSKRVPGKNLVDLNGKPLIAYTIEAALESIADYVMVASENEQILKVAQKYGVLTIKRPTWLAMDHIQTQHVCTWVVRKYENGEIPDIDIPLTDICMLAPTSPFRTASHINQGIMTLQNWRGVGTAMSGSWSDVRGTSGYFWQQQPDGSVMPLNGDPLLRGGTQYTGRVFLENGAVYVTSLASISYWDNYRVRPFWPIVMSKEDSLDIDTLADFNEARQRMRA